MKTKTTTQLYDMQEAMRQCQKARNNLVQAKEHLLASKAGMLAQHIQEEIERWELIARDPHYNRGDDVG